MALLVLNDEGLGLPVQPVSLAGADEHRRLQVEMGNLRDQCQAISSGLVALRHVRNLAWVSPEANSRRHVR
jgi:hypothetical protein